MTQPLLCIGPGGEHLCEELSRLTGLESVGVHCRTFPDQETCVRLNKSVTDRVVLVVQGTHPPQDRHLQQLYQMVEVTHSQGAAYIACVVPYLAYARQDRRSTPGEPLSALIVLRTLAMLGARCLVTIDIHNPNMLADAPLSVSNLSTEAMMAEWLVQSGMQNPVLISPDEGGRLRVERIAELLGWPFIVCRKQKDATGRTWYGQHADPVKVADGDVVILDDLCSSGTTLIPLTLRLKEQNVRNFYYGVTHFFPEASKIESMLPFPVTICCTNTIPSAYSRLSVAPLIVEWLRHSTFTL